MAAYIVYLDVLLLLNFCVDFTLLVTAGGCLGRSTRLWRQLLAAAVGAAYGGGMVFPVLAVLYLPPAAVAVSVLLLLIAYPWRGWRDLLRLAAVFYLIAFAMAGSALAAVTWLAEQGYVIGGTATVRWVALLSILPVAVILGRRGLSALRRAWRKEDFRAELTVQLAGRSCRLSTLIDTGNDLREPLSGLPVAVADQKAILTLLPEKMRWLLRQWEQRPDELLRQLSLAPELADWLRRARLVPFASIGQRHGTLLGLRPDRVLLSYEGQQREIEIIIAVSRLGGDSCQAVLNPCAMEDGSRWRKELGA